MTNIPTRISPGLVIFQPYFRRADSGIENWQDVIDPAFQDLIGVGIQADIRVLAHMHGIQIILVNVTDDPDIRKIGNRKGIGARQTLHARCIGNLLVRDYT